MQGVWCQGRSGATLTPDPLHGILCAASEDSLIVCCIMRAIGKNNRRSSNDRISYFKSALFCHDTSILSVLGSWLSARYACGVERLDWILQAGLSTGAYVGA